MKLPEAFYLREDVVQIARDLLGKYLVTDLGGGITAGMITETEAYAGVIDRASHAYNNRRTARTEIMYRRGGAAYVYLCYGVHSLFNVVTNSEDIPHAVLVRGIYPVQGLEVMKERTGKEKIGLPEGNGPGKVANLLGIHYSQSGTNLLGDKIWIEDRGFRYNGSDIITGTRVGVVYAGSDALLPYRFILKPVAFLK